VELQRTIRTPFAAIRPAPRHPGDDRSCGTTAATRDIFGWAKRAERGTSPKCRGRGDDRHNEQRAASV